MNALVAKLCAVLGRTDVKGIIGSLAVKAASILSAFALFTFAARVLGEEKFGQFAMFFSGASMLAVVAIFGQEMLIIRTWSEKIASGQYDLVKGGIVFGVLASLVGGGLAASAIMIYLAQTETLATILSAGAFVAIAVLLLFFSSLCRTVVSVFAGDGQRELTAFFPANVFLIVCFAIGASTTITWVINLLTLGMCAGLAVQAFLLQRTMHDELGKVLRAETRFDFDLWMPSSFRLWFASILEATNQHLDVILIGFLMDPIAAGAYFVATRLANGFASVADGFNMFATRRFPNLYYKRAGEELSSLLQTLAILIALTIGIGLLVVVLAGQWLLAIFGSEYMAFSQVLLILCLGTTAMAASGPAAPILMLTGGEGPYLKIVAISVATRILGFVALIPAFGIYGAAIATTVSLAIMAVMIGVKAKTITGLNVTVTRLFSSGTQSMPTTKEA